MNNIIYILDYVPIMKILKGRDSVNYFSTEERNPSSLKLDSMSIEEIILLMNKEDSTVPKVIRDQLPEISRLTEIVIEKIRTGGRLFYIGAGTSGRLGLLDAVECVPTFGTSPNLVQGLIAGGTNAFIKAVEGAEDSEVLAREDLKAKKLSKKDIVIGIAASGRTPYVVGGLTYAKEIGAETGSIVNNFQSPISQLSSYPVEIVTGPEVLTGSTRLKAGTAQKLVLNMISTITMVKLGKVYGNLMVDVQSTNQKLVYRSKQIIMDATGCTYEVAEEFFNNSENSAKLAIIRILSGISLEHAKKLLKKNEGRVRESLEAHKNILPSPSRQ